VIDLSYLDVEFIIRETPNKLLKINIDSEKSHQFGDTLKAQSHVELRGAGDRYDGVYTVEKVSHSVKKGRYKTSFTLKK
jgi:hypothetical protein